jgi:glycosyltransferase involved in cell wall biosynthesis
LSEPDVSVVIPTRSRCRRLEIAVRSALAQRGVDLEVLIVDDGSTDATERMVTSISDPRIRFLKRAVSGGVSAARNVGIADAKGPWIAFLDDDDVWAPTKLTRQLDVMAKGGRMWSYTGEVMVDGELKIFAGGPPPPPDEVVRQLERHNSVPGSASSVVVHADTLSEAGSFDPGLTSSEDWDMWIRLASAGPPDWVSSPLVAVSYHRQNASGDMAAMLRQLDVVAERHGITVDRVRHLRWAAWRALQEDRRADAVRLYGRAIRAGDVGSIGRAMVAVLRPSYANRRTRPGDPGNEQDPWILEARAWLDALRGAEGSPCDES